MNLIIKQVCLVAPLGAALACGAHTDTELSAEDFDQLGEALSPNDWTPWSPLPANATGIDGAPAVARSFDNTIDVIIRDNTTNRLRRSRKSGYNGAWSAWTDLGTDTFNSKPAASSYPASCENGRYAVIARKTNNRFYVRVFSGNGVPTQAWTLVANDQFASAPGISLGGGELVITGRKQDGRVYYSRSILNCFAAIGQQTFSLTPPPPAGKSFVGDPTVSMASSWQNGGPAFYSRLNDDTFATHLINAVAPPSPWFSISTFAYTSDPAVTDSRAVGLTTIYGKGAANRMTQSTGFFDSWQSLQPINADDTFNTAAAAADGTFSYGGPNGVNLAHHVVARKSDGRIWHSAHPEQCSGACP